MLNIFAYSLMTHALYTHDFSFIFSMWDFVLFLICAGDVTARGASDRAIKTRPLIITKGEGYVVHSYLSTNHF